VYKIITTEKITQSFLDNWKTKRGYTEELRTPEDQSYDIIEKMFKDNIFKVS
jgi:hypothetical protein